MDKFLEKIDKLVVFFIIYTILFLVFFKTLSYTLPFVLAFVFALILQKPTKYLVKKFKIKISLASILTTIIFFTIIISLLTWGIAALTTEAIQLGKNTQVYITGNTDLINKYVDILREYYKNLDPSIVKTIQDSLSSSINKISALTASFVGGMVSGLLNFLASVPYIIMVVLFTLLATYFFTKDMTSAKNKIRDIIPSQSTIKLSYIVNESKKMLGGYAFSYTIIIFITFLETLIGFSIFRVKYTLILSVVSAIFDLLPILGIGSIYVPVAIIYYISGSKFTAFGVLILYGVVSLIRQIIEPRIVSSSLGLHPVAVLAAIFIGLKASGIAGMFFCMFLVVFYNIFRKVKVL